MAEPDLIIIVHGLPGQRPAIVDEIPQPFGPAEHSACEKRLINSPPPDDMADVWRDIIGEELGGES